MRRLACNFAMLLSLLLASPVAADPVVFVDDTFADADWQVASQAVSPVSSYTVGQDAAAGVGNPSPYRRMTITNPVDPLGGPSTFTVVNFRRVGWTYDPSVSGAIDHIDISQDRIIFDILVGGNSTATGGVGYLFRLYQGGSYFVSLEASQAFTNRQWQTTALTGLTAEDFVSGALHPDFSASGGPITFGYTASNTNTGQSADVVTIHGIDNFSVTVFPAPEPAAALLLALGVALALGGRSARS
jgi:hypothetical protein